MREPVSLVAEAFSTNPEEKFVPYREILQSNSEALSRESFRRSVHYSFLISGVVLAIDRLVLPLPFLADNYMPSLVHGAFAFCTSLLLAARVSNAKERWSEGRSHQTKLYASTNKIAIQLSKLQKEYYSEGAKDLFKRAASLLNAYTRTVQCCLHNDREANKALKLLPKDLREPFSEANHKVIFIVTHLLATELDIKNHPMIKMDQETNLQLNINKENLPEIFSLCEKVKNTPVPSVFDSGLEKSLGVFLLTMPFTETLAAMGYWNIPAIATCAFFFRTLINGSKEMENPFDPGVTNIPVKSLVARNYGRIKQIFSF